ncbi:MAG TPA: PAS domain S-box protein [Bacteroidota bacterium]|nr:PAS domain S-box protein [Bacteroidota bacterium]
MNARSESDNVGSSLRDKIIGLGERSIRKSYYPQLRQQLEETEKSRSELMEKSIALMNMLDDLEGVRSRLAESEARYRSLVENINDVIYSLDLKGTVTYISPVIRNISGLTPEEIIGRHFEEHIHPDDRAMLVEAYYRDLAGHVEPHEFRFRKKDGSFLFARAFSRPLLEDSRVVGLTGVMSDITDRKRAEDEVRHLNLELEKRVAERTAQLEFANKELEAFSYSVSHDLRAPVRSLDGFSKIVLEEYQEKIDESGQNYLLRIRSSAQYMAQLIDDLLKLSLVNRTGLIMQQVNLSRMAREIADRFHEQEPGREVEFRIQEGITLQADNHFIRIVLENLLANAWKFTSTHPTARIEFGMTRQGKTPVLFIRDDGAGFDMNYKSKLFGVFQRLHSKAEFPGTGIGLATVQRIIYRHGGAVWAEGEVEHGATFFFTLPSGD